MPSLNHTREICLDAILDKEMGLEALQVRVRVFAGTVASIRNVRTRIRTLRKSAWEGHFREQGEEPNPKLMEVSNYLVPRRGLEPPRLSPLVPETSASTNSATWASRAT